MHLGISPAVRLARQAVGAPDDLPASAVVVRRLDRDGEYVLVQIGRPGEPGWVAAVDPRSEDVMTWAANPSGSTTVPDRPGDAPDGDAELVWRPGAHSRSPLYPLLRIAAADGDRFVDLAGQVHEPLPDSRG
jgi:hypothetical protein